MYRNGTKAVNGFDVKHDTNEDSGAQALPEAVEHCYQLRKLLRLYLAAPHR